MQEIYITKLPNLLITFGGQKVTVPELIREKIDRHWQKLVANNSHLHNGEVFTVTSVQENDSVTTIELAETDYAHYLYGHQVGGLGKNAVRIIHPATLLISMDGKFIFGAMGDHTSLPGVIQCSGGGVDFDDIKDGVVDVQNNVARELAEELGLDFDDSNRVASCRPAYLKAGGPTGKMTIAYVLHLKRSAQEFLGEYERFAQVLRERGEVPEFGKLFAVEANSDSIEEFIVQNEGKFNEYMPATLRQAQKDFGANSF